MDESNYELFMSALNSGASNRSTMESPNLQEVNSNPDYLTACLQELGESTPMLAPSSSEAMSVDCPEMVATSSNVGSSLASNAARSLQAKSEVKEGMTAMARNLVAVNRGKIF